MNIDEAMEAALGRDDEGDPAYVIAQAFAAQNSAIEVTERALNEALERCVEIEDELRQQMEWETTAARVDERRKIADAFEVHASTFSEGITVESLVFMLRLGT